VALFRSVLTVKKYEMIKDIGIRLKNIFVNIQKQNLLTAFVQDVQRHFILIFMGRVK